MRSSAQPAQQYARQDEDFMRMALDLAKAAGDAEEPPVGAVVVRAGQVIGEGSNTRERSNDPTAHAEIAALQEAARTMGSWRLSGTTIYVTLEPCPMCAGALVLARADRVVFGAADPKAGACGSIYNICSDPRLNHELSITRGVLAAECSAMLVEWFSARRT